MSESAAADDLLTLLVFWIAAYLSSWLAEKTRLSPLLFYLVLGSVLGNVSRIDRLRIIHTSPSIHFVSELAITLVFLALGFEENVENFVNGIKKAWGIASIGAVVPFLCGLSCSLIFFPDMDTNAHLLVGLAVTATAVSLTMISLKSEGLALSRAAIGIMTSAVLDDVACLAFVAIMVPVASGQAEPTAAGIGWVVGKSLIFFAIIVLLNMFVLPTIGTEDDAEKHPFLARIPGLRSVGVSPLIKFLHGEQATLATLIIGLGIGLLALAFGFHPAIGAYMAGLIFEERYFDIDAVVDEDEEVTAALDEPQPNVYGHVKDVLESAAFCWIGPVFFLNLGSQIIIKADLLLETLGPTLGFFVALFVGQILSAALAARFVPGGFTWTEAWMIGFGMLGRAELFFVVLNVAYLDNKILSEKMFFSLTMAAMLLNISVPITISLYKPYYIKAQLRDPGKPERAVSQRLFQNLYQRATKDRAARDRRVFKPTTTDSESDAVKICEMRRFSIGSLEGRNSDIISPAHSRISSKGTTPTRMSSKTQLRYSDIDVITPPPISPPPPDTEKGLAPPTVAAWGDRRPSSRGPSVRSVLV